MKKFVSVLFVLGAAVVANQADAGKRYYCPQVVCPAAPRVVTKIDTYRPNLQPVLKPALCEPLPSVIESTEEPRQLDLTRRKAQAAKFLKLIGLVRSTCECEAGCACACCTAGQKTARITTRVFAEQECEEIDEALTPRPAIESLPGVQE